MIEVLTKTRRERKGSLNKVTTLHIEGRANLEKIQALIAFLFYENVRDIDRDAPSRNARISIAVCEVYTSRTEAHQPSKQNQKRQRKKGNRTLANHVGCD